MTAAFTSTAACLAPPHLRLAVKAAGRPERPLLAKGEPAPAGPIWPVR